MGRERINGGKQIKKLLFIPAIFFLWFFQVSYAQDLEVHFIDVGQGDSILIKTPNNENILIDAGKHSDPDNIYNPFRYLDSQGVKKLDALFITHPHDDHYRGFQYLCNKDDKEKFPIAAIYYSVKPGEMYGTSFNTCLDKLIKTCESSGQVSSRGPPLKFGDVEFTVFYPVEPIITPAKTKNPDSIVMKMTYKKVNFLFTGDTVKKIEKTLDDDLESMVLKVAHHGAKTSTDADKFLKRVKPKYAVISCNDKDYGNNYGHPHKETLESLREHEVKLYRTDLNGTIVMKTDGDSITVTDDKNVEQQSKSLWQPGEKLR